MLDDPAAALERARAAGVDRVVTIGIDPASSQGAAELAAAHPGVAFTVGVHPHDAAGAGEADWAALESLARQRGAAAWGECGLDFFRDRAPRQAQRRAFARQIELALGLGLPLVVHSREAHQETLAMLAEQDAGRVGGVVHCFSGDWPLARRVLDLGFLLGVDGPVTYPKSDRLREVCSRAPMESLLLETDCPFLAPQAVRGRTNEPAFLPYICQGVARARACPPEEVAAASSRAARRLFGLGPEPEAADV
jgi:TatD DNase family protein